MLYDFKAKKVDGKVIEGTVEAAHEAMARGLVKERGFEPFAITKHRRSLLTFNIAFFSSVSVKEITIWSRQLSVMVSANLPIVAALKTLANQAGNPLMRTVIAEAARDVEGGARLSSALARHPKIFSNFFVQMVRSGETSGRLDDVLNYLADQQEKDYDLISKIRGAMMYPAFILSGLLVVGFIMMTFVIPKLTAVISESGATLPWTTRLLIATSGFFVHYWWLVIVIVIGAGIGFFRFIATPSGRATWDAFKLKIPIFGTLFSRIYLVRFCRSLSTLMIGGVPLATSLAIVAEVVGNSVFKTLVLDTAKAVKDGHPLTSIFQKHKIFPAMASEMLATGERTGKLEDILSRLSTFYSREIDNLVTNMVSLIEPLIMVLMGLAVGVMVSAIILPMYNLANEL